MTCLSVSEKMDSQVQVEGRLLDVVDDQWRTETLPLDDIHVGDLCLIFQHYSPPMVFWSSSEAIGCKKYLNLIFKVPATELPDPEADNANPGDSLRQQVDKKIYVASYKVIKTIDQYYPSTPSAITPQTEMQKVADPADISVLFFQLVIIFGTF